MVNLISPNNSQAVPKGIEPTHASKSSSTTSPTAPTSASTTGEKPQITQVQWAKLESNTTLSTQQKAQLTELNPTLAKTLIGQIKGEPQSANNTLSPQNIALLKQNPLQLLRLTLDNTSLHTVTPNNISALLNTRTQLPMIATQNGWKIASSNELKTALQTAATQILKQNLPLQTSSMPLFKMAHTLSGGKATALAHLVQTQNHLAALHSQTIDKNQAKNPQQLGRELQSALRPSTTLNQITTIQQSLNSEVAVKNPDNLLNTTQALTQLEKSLHQLQQSITTNIPTINKSTLSTLSTLQNNIGVILNSKQDLTPMQLSHTQQMNKVLLTLIDTSKKHQSQENINSIISQQLNTLVKPLNSMITTFNTPANNAIMQLLGIALHGQQLDQHNVQQKTQQQLKALIDRVSAKLHVNQLRHLGLDSPKETTAPMIQQLQGELPLRFNEQILPLTYHIQGFDEERTEQRSGEKNNDTKEKTRRWQVFMSLDLPQNETLHCKLSLIDNHIDTTLWAESAQLCKKTQELINELEDRFTQAGLTVDTLQCFEGKPPQNETSINYNLVDVTT